MKLGKIKNVVKRDKHAAIINTKPDNNLISQWIGSHRALYPVRGIRLEHTMMPVLWEMQPYEYETMMCDDVEATTDALEMAASAIDEDTAPKNFVANINGYMVIGSVQSKEDEWAGLCDTVAYMVDERLLEPCRDGNKYLHMLPVYCNDEPWVLVYSGSELAGLVKAENDDVCRTIINTCARVGTMHVVEG